jgi:hypothetical protein
MVQASQGGELPPERLFVLRRGDTGHFLEGKLVTRALEVVDEPHASRSAFAEELLGNVPAGRQVLHRCGFCRKRACRGMRIRMMCLVSESHRFSTVLSDLSPSISDSNATNHFSIVSDTRHFIAGESERVLEAN